MTPLPLHSPAPIARPGPDRARIARLVEELLDAIGDDPARPGLRLTPDRVADSWSTFFAGVGRDERTPLARSTPTDRAVGGHRADLSGLVLARGIRFRSVCEHHLLPFVGTAHLALLPDAHTATAEVLVEVLEILACRPQVQERLGEEIAETLSDGLSARGVVVILDATHQCVTTRGDRQPDASTVTVAARGVLATPARRAEIVGLIAADVGALRAPTSRAARMR